MHRSSKFSTCFLALTACFGAALPGALRGQEDASARQILDAAGVRCGLCIHVGCGSEKSPGLTAALAAASTMHVHALAADDASAARARKCIEDQGLLGRALVERIAVDPLPYVRDLANLVVVEDFDSLAATGLKISELRRVVAPGGSLCMMTGGHWETWRKPRPQQMDDWPQPSHGADGNRVSADRVVQFPVGLRWQDGIPMNFNLWAACRGWVIANGRCFTLSTTEFENLAPASFGKHREEEFVTARDAFNGLPLWKVNCRTTNDGKYLNAWNPAPIVADDQRVYVYKENCLCALDAATGRVVTRFPVKFPSTRLLLLQDVLVSAGWEAKEEGKDPGPQTLWAPWVSKTRNGSVEAFDARDGQRLWSLEQPAQEMLADGGVVYVLLQTGNPAKEQQILVIDLHTGQQRWKVPHTRFAAEAGLHLGCAGQGVLVVARTRAKAISALSAGSGKTLWEIKPTERYWTPIVDGTLWHDNKKYDLQTGKVKGDLSAGIDSPVCTPSAVVGNYVTQSRGCGYLELLTTEDGKPKGANWISFGGARGGCIEGAVPACGMFFTSQNNCRCAPGQVQGFVGYGPCGKLPVAADFQQARPVERGPAFGDMAQSPATDGEWPMLGHDALRSNRAKLNMPKELSPRWTCDVCRPAQGPLADAWKARLVSCLSAPVAAQGMVFVAAVEQGQVIALDADRGTTAWRFTAGGRIDTPPTVYQGLCLFGCHDGWVYAVRARDGKLVWRTRAAVWERRMMSFGQIESVWPVIGSVLIHDNTLYATAGRSFGADGGVALCALSLRTGESLWAKGIDASPPRVNDLLSVNDGKLLLQTVRIDPKTGRYEVPKDVLCDDMDGAMDGTWTRLGNRRSGNLNFGRAKAEMLAWNDSTLFGYEGPSRCVYALAREKTTGKGNLAAKDYTWRQALPPDYQAEAMVLTDNGLVVAGRVCNAKQKEQGGFLWMVSLEDGKKTIEKLLDSPPSYQGLAVAGQRAYVSLQNGRVVSFGQ